MANIPSNPDTDGSRETGTGSQTLENPGSFVEGSRKTGTDIPFPDLVTYGSRETGTGSKTNDSIVALLEGEVDYYHMEPRTSRHFQRVVTDMAKDTIEYVRAIDPEIELGTLRTLLEDVVDRSYWTEAHVDGCQPNADGGVDID